MLLFCVLLKVINEEGVFSHNINVSWNFKHEIGDMQIKNPPLFYEQRKVGINGPPFKPNCITEIHMSHGTHATNPMVLVLTPRLGLPLFNNTINCFIMLNTLYISHDSPPTNTCSLFYPYLKF